MTEPFVTSGTSERSDDIRLTGVSPLFDACPAVTLSELTRRVRGGEQQGGDQWFPRVGGRECWAKTTVAYIMMAARLCVCVCGWTV